MVFISASVADDAKSVSFVPRSIEQTAKKETNEKKTRSAMIAYKFETLTVFDRLSLPIMHALSRGKKE